MLYWVEIDVSTFFVVFDNLKIDKNINVTCVIIWNEIITQFNQIKTKIYKLKKQNFDDCFLNIYAKHYWNRMFYDKCDKHESN